VFLIPQLANRQSASDLAVQFVKFDPDNPKEMEKYKEVTALLKPAVTQVANQGKLKAGDVCRFVEPIVKSAVSDTAKFTPSYHHVAACQFYKIRPQNNSDNLYDTDLKYCQYDEPHKDYVYTNAWKQFLIKEMKKQGQYNKIIEAYKLQLKSQN
jgi:hypothetical protein